MDPKTVQTEVVWSPIRRKYGVGGLILRRIMRRYIPNGRGTGVYFLVTSVSDNKNYVRLDKFLIFIYLLPNLKRFSIINSW